MLCRGSPLSLFLPGVRQVALGPFPVCVSLQTALQKTNKQKKHASSSVLTANTGVDFYVRNCVSGLRSRGVPSRFPHRAVHVPHKGSGCSPSSPTLDAVSLSHCSKVYSDFSPRYPDEALNVSTGCLDSLFLKSPWKPILLRGFLQFRHSFIGVLTVSVSLFSDIRPNYLLHLSNGWSLHSADAELR